MIMGVSTRPAPANGSLAPRSCPAAGAKVEQKGGPAFEFLGADPNQPDLCLMRVDGEPFSAWFGIWGQTWPGAEDGHQALRRSMNGRTGEVFGFNTVAQPGAQWHDFVRQEGVEDIYILGKLYRAMKLAHYREGYGGNAYRSVSTLWKDVATGLPIYGTYQHISGAPELDGVLVPARITPAP